MDPQQLEHIRRMYLHPALLPPAEKIDTLVFDPEEGKEREGVLLDEIIEESPISQVVNLQDSPRSQRVAIELVPTHIESSPKSKKHDEQQSLTSEIFE